MQTTLWKKLFNNDLTRSNLTRNPIRETSNPQLSYLRHGTVRSENQQWWLTECGKLGSALTAKIPSSFGWVYLPVWVSRCQWGLQSGLPPGGSEINSYGLNVTLSAPSQPMRCGGRSVWGHGQRWEGKQRSEVDPEKDALAEVIVLIFLCLSLSKHIFNYISFP